MVKDASAGSWSFAAATLSRDMLGSRQITVVWSTMPGKQWRTSATKLLVKNVPTSSERTKHELTVSTHRPHPFGVPGHARTNRGSSSIAQPQL
jgi:hypothetical protein